MKTVQIHNFSGQSLDLEADGVEYKVPTGANRIELSGSSATITRADSSNFTVSLGTSRTDVTVSTTGHTTVQGASFYENYAEGLGLGIAVLFAAMALRMVKQLGYHSQDI